MVSMRIALVAGSFPKLSETFVLQQIACLLDEGHDVRIFAFDRPEERTVHPEVAELRLLRRTTYLKGPHNVRSRAAAMVRAIKREPPRQFDAIICHFGPTAEKARVFRENGFFSGPLCAFFHAYDLTTWLREQKPGYYDRLFAAAELLLPISEYWRKRLIDLGADPRKVIVRHMGVDTGKLSFAPRRPQQDEPLRLISVARLVEKKGIAYALDALALVRPNLGRALEYHIVGDGPLRDELQQRTSRLGLTDEVRFVGELDGMEVGRLMRSMHGLLAPSVTASNGDMEGIPVALMEAMAQGLPVISTQHSGIPELVRDGQTGFCVAEADATALAEGILSWARNPDDWPTLTREARRLVEAEFDVRAQTRALLDDVIRLRQSGR